MIEDSKKYSPNIEKRKNNTYEVTILQSHFAPTGAPHSRGTSPETHNGLPHVAPVGAKCGAGRDRTDDLLRARQALSQLSYNPKIFETLSDIEFKKIPDDRFFHPWWARVDLNYRPHAYQACALTN
jgi:hypothetical protein